MIYIEIRTMGRWTPQIWSYDPPVKEINGKSRLTTADGQGPEVRAVTPVNDNLKNLTLDQLREVFSPDGKFYRCGP